MHKIKKGSNINSFIFKKQIAHAHYIRFSFLFLLYYFTAMLNKINIYKSYLQKFIFFFLEL